MHPSDIHCLKAPTDKKKIAKREPCKEWVSLSRIDIFRQVPPVVMQVNFNTNLTMM